MKIDQYIIIKGRKTSTYSSHRKYSSRLSKGSPRLDADEVAVNVSIELPEAIFEKPSLQANIIIPEDVILKPVISAEVIDNVQEIIKQNTGFEVKLTVVELDDDTKGE